MNRSLILPVVALALIAAGGVYSRFQASAEAEPRALSTVSSATPGAPQLAPAEPAPMLGMGADALPASLSPEGARLEERRILYETVDSLLQAAEFSRARSLLDQDADRSAADSSGDWRDLELGYRVVADCLQHPSPKSRARGESLLLVTPSSPLASKIRAACK